MPGLFVGVQTRNVIEAGLPFGSLGACASMLPSMMFPPGHVRKTDA